jgi:hypothetical protein
MEQQQVAVNASPENGSAIISALCLIPSREMPTQTANPTSIRADIAGAKLGDGIITRE